VDRALRLIAVLGLLLAASAASAQEPDAAAGASQAPAAPAEATSAASAGGGTDAKAWVTPRPPWWSSGSLAHADLYDIVRGPAFLAAWVVFALGLLFRVRQYFRLTTPQHRTPAQGEARVPRPRESGFADRGAPAADRSYLLQGRSAPARAWISIRLWARGTILGSNPVIAVVSLVFHALLFLAPLLLPAHNILFDLTFGVSLPTLREQAVDALTVIVILACCFFLFRRVLIARVRALTSGRDWLVLLLVAAPFLTAYLAYHQMLDYGVVLVTHMIVGELVIAAVPFSPIGHMPFILFSRIFTVGEYAWRPGSRRWK
jgi:nitrate reductase gamma subunit